MQKGQSPILIIVGILVVGLIAGAYYFGIQKSQTPASRGEQAPVVTVQPTATPQSATSSAETANWKTYINKEFHFSFQYPGNWSPKSDPYNITVKSPDVSPEFKEPIAGASFYMEFHLLAGIPEAPAPIMTPERLEENTQSTDTREIKNKKVATFLGKPAITYDAQEAINAEIEGINIGYDDKFFRILMYNYDRKVSNKQILDQILSTFKFTQ